MSRRKGELTQPTIDREWPHQVAVPAEIFLGSGYVTVHLFCEGLSLCRRHARLVREGREYIVCCFADPEHAERFRVRFNGEAMKPAQRKALDDRRRNRCTARR